MSYKDLDNAPRASRNHESPPSHPLQPIASARGTAIKGHTPRVTASSSDIILNMLETHSSHGHHKGTMKHLYGPLEIGTRQMDTPRSNVLKQFHIHGFHSLLPSYPKQKWTRVSLMRLFKQKEATRMYVFARRAETRVRPRCKVSQRQNGQMERSITDQY